MLRSCSRLSCLEPNWIELCHWADRVVYNFFSITGLTFILCTYQSRRYFVIAESEALALLSMVSRFWCSRRCILLANLFCQCHVAALMRSRNQCLLADYHHLPILSLTSSPPVGDCTAMETVARAVGLLHRPSRALAFQSCMGRSPGEHSGPF